MKKFMKKNLMRFVLGMTMLLAGVQSAFASCSGTVYFKAPSDWTQAVFFMEQGTTPKTVTTKDANGYYVVDLSSVSQEIYTTKFGIAKFASVGTANYIVMDTSWMYQNAYSSLNLNATLPCPGDGEAVYVSEDAFNPGETYIGSVPQNVKYFYVFIPEERLWQSDELMVHYELGDVAKDATMSPAPNMCGWSRIVFDKVPTNTYLYLRNYPDMQIGMNGLWDEDDNVDPIDLGMLYDAYGTNSLYFIPDDNAWPDEGSDGWYIVDPAVDGNCSFTLAAVIYDTDMKLNSAFSDCCGSGKAQAPAGVESCVGVQHGLVMEDLGEDNKPVFSGSAAAQACFGGTSDAQTNFNALFNYVAGMNEVQCYDMPFRHYGTDSRWAYLSDSAVTNDLVGGFFPLENSTDAGVLTLNVNGVPTLAGPLTAARVKREASGPVVNHAKEAFGMELDYYCKTPGWPTGKECQGLFADGSEFTSPDLWCWGDYCEPGFQRWGLDSDYKPSEKRNQHFCFESHAKFTYNENQEFTVIGDDDIWVFINKKLAVDNGGAHLPAPGHVVLKNLNTTYGAGFLVPGQDYPIDIFVCDRRTTMSTLNIKTNIYIKQFTGVDLQTEKNADGGLKLNICVERSGGGDCAGVALGESKRECGNEISSQINYSITTRKGEIPAGCAGCAALPLGSVSYGGIDLTNPKVPIVYPDRVMGLAPGSYRLYVEVDGKKNYIQFAVRGNLGIISKDAEFINVDDDASAYPSGTKWKFINKAMAGTRVPIYISAPDDYGGVDILSTSGQSYTLTLSAGVTLYKTNDPNDISPLPSPYSGVVNATGIDTIWLEVPLAGMTSDSVEVKASVGNTSATITYYLPQLTFARPATKDSAGNVLTWNPVTQDPDVDSKERKFYHKLNADVDFNVIAINPATGALCTECKFLIDIISASDGIVGQITSFANGVAQVRIRSNKEYVESAASMVVGAIENNAIATPYGNMHFVDADEAQDEWGDVEQSGEEIGTEPSEESGKDKDSEGDSEDDSGKGSGKDSGKEGDSGDDSDDDDSDDDIEYAKPSFHIEMTGPFEFKIVMDESVPAKARAYAVMDLQGNILRQGEIESSGTIVEGLNYGSYVVKVGLGHHRVNIH